MNYNILTEKLALAERLCSSSEFAKANNILNNLNVNSLEPEDAYNFHLLSGVCAYEFTSNPSAITHFKKCVEIIDRHNLSISKLSALHELSSCYFKLFAEMKGENALQLSIHYCQEELRESIANSYVEKSTGFMRYYVETTQNILKGLVHLSVLYQTYGDIENSNRILEVAKVCCKRHYDWKTIGAVYDELAANCIYTGDIDKSLYYYSKSLNVKTFINNENGLNITKKNIENNVFNHKTQYISLSSNLNINTIKNISKDESL